MSAPGAVHPTDSAAAAGSSVPSASSQGRGVTDVWDPFCPSPSLQKPLVGFASSCVIKGTEKVEALSAWSKFSAFSPADLQTGVPQWCVCARALETVPVLLEGTQTTCYCLSPLSCEPEMGSCQSSGCPSPPWLICRESRHPPKNPAPGKHAACCQRPPCWGKACRVWVRRITAWERENMIFLGVAE